MPRILVLVPEDVDLAGEIEAARSAADPGTEIVTRNVPLASVPPVSAQDWALADLAMMAAGQTAMEEGFDFVAMGRALLREPHLVSEMAEGRDRSSLCIQCNKCMATIYKGTHCVLDSVEA